MFLHKIAWTNKSGATWPLPYAYISGFTLEQWLTSSLWRGGALLRQVGAWVFSSPDLKGYWPGVSLVLPLARAAAAPCSTEGSASASWCLGILPPRPKGIGLVSHYRGLCFGKTGILPPIPEGLLAWRATGVTFGQGRRLRLVLRRALLRQVGAWVFSLPDQKASAW